jgi:hypothetical protein
MRQDSDVPEQDGELFPKPAEPPVRAEKCWERVKADTYRWPRWLTATVVLVGFIAGLLGSRFHVCNDDTVTKGAETTVTHTCKGPGVSDAEVVAIALFIVLLLVPDMSEVGVFGVSLKRRLAAAEDKASESVAKAENLERQLQLQSVQVESLNQTLQHQSQLQSQRVETLTENLQHLRVEMLTQNAAAAAAHSQATGNTMIIGGETLRDLTIELPDKVSAFERGVTPPKAKVDRRAITAQYPQLATRLIANWEDISELTELQPGSRWTDDVRFTSTFQEELEVVRAARNTVAHAKPISPQDLRAAVDISDRLLETLRDSRGRSGSGGGY